MSLTLETPPTVDDDGSIVPLQGDVTPKFELSRLMVVAITNDGQQKAGALMARSQVAPNGPWEKSWSEVDKTNTYGILTAGLTGDGRVAVIAQPTSVSEGILVITETEDASGSEASWNAPVDLGFPPGYTFDYLYTTVDAGGRMEVFGIDHEYGHLWWIYQNPDQIVTKTVTVTPPGSNDPITIEVEEKEPPKTPWSSWIQLGSELFTEVSVTNCADDRVIVFGREKKSGNLLWSEQSKLNSLAASDWSAWARLDNSDIGPLGDITALLDDEGAVNVFGIDKSGQVVHAKQSPPNGSEWTPWSRPGMTPEKIDRLTAGIDGDGHIALIAQAASKTLYGNMQISVADAQWNTWQPINSAGEPAFAMALNYNADGRLTLFRQNEVTSKKEFTELHCMSQVAVNATEWEASWTALSGKSIRRYAVVRDLTPPAGGDG